MSCGTVADNQTTELVTRLRECVVGHPALMTAAADEIERLRATLREIRRDIEEAADDVVWMRGGIETVHDRITAVLGDQQPPTWLKR